MFDFLRNITKSAEEKREERLNAYLDDALSDQDRSRFEQEIEQDADLRADLEQLRWVKLSVERMPRVRAPRNFVLDPAVYGQKESRRPAAFSGFYPGLRVATALTAFFFILTLALDLATPYGALDRPLLGAASQVAMEESSRQADDTTMLAAEPEMESTPAEEPAPEISAFSITEEPDVGEVAEEAAEEESMEEAMTAAQAEEEEAVEETVEERPEAETPEEPGIGAAGPAEDRTLQPPETADGDALPPRGTPGPDVVVTEVHTLTVVTVTPPIEDTPDLETQVATRTATPFPYLLVIEIILGAALAGLVVVMLILRRGG